MPLYRYECARCGRQDETFNSVDNRHDGPRCHGRGMSIVICAANVQPDIPGYESPTTGRWIEGRAARRDDLKRSNARPYEGFEAERREARRRLQESEAKSDHKLEEAVRRNYHALSPDKRRALESNT